MIAKGLSTLVSFLNNREYDIIEDCCWSLILFYDAEGGLGSTLV